MSHMFKSLLATSGAEKLAGIERPDQQQMEQDFSQMAAQFVLDRAEALAPYGLGFEIVERDDEGSRVCGVFGYKIGKEFYMVPAFFINGQIKGLNSIYSKSSNSFSPLTEGYINKLIARSTIELGDGVSRKGVQRNLETPDLSIFRSPTIGKTAAATEAMQEMWKQAKAGVCGAIAEDPVLQKDIASFLMKAGKHENLEAESADGSALVGFLKQTGPKMVNAFLGSCADAKVASAVIDTYGSLKPFMIEAFNKGAIEFQKKAATEKKVEIVYAKSQSESGCCAPCCSNDIDRKRMVRDGFIIKDRRTSAEKSQLFAIEYPTSFNPPEKPNLYNVLLSSGVTTEAWILTPFAVDKRGLWACVETDKHCLMMAESKKLFTRDAPVVDGKGFYETAKSLDTVKVDGRYLFINEAGNYLGPIRVTGISKAPGGRTQLSVSWQFFSMADGIPYPEYGTSAHHRDTIEIVETRKGAPTLAGSGDIITLPADGMKVLELNGSGDTERQDYESEEKKSFRPGNPMDVKDFMYKAGFHRLTVASDPGLDSEFSVILDGVASKPVNYKVAFTKMVSHYGLDVDDAEGMLVEAQQNFRSSRYVLTKHAQDAGGVNMPWITPPEFSGSDPYSGMMQQQPFEATLTGDQPDYLPQQQPFQPGMAESDPSIPADGQLAAPDPEAMNVAVQAAQAGQKTVFDHAGIAGLAKLYDVNTVVDSYMPEMTKALDRIGRILFLFQWKNDEFADRFGVDSLPEMEDLLVSVYKSYGDLLLKLREKAVNPDESATVNM